MLGYVINFVIVDKDEISNGMKIEFVGGSFIRICMVFYLICVNYDYKNKYYLGGSFCIDGSFCLYKDSCWGSFWLVFVVWCMIEEEFMNLVKGWLIDLKICVFYGVNGILLFDYFGYMGLSSLINGYLE